MKSTDFAVRLTAFLGQYLPAQKNVSPNTIKAYRDAFTLLLRYCRDEQNVPPEKVTLNMLNASLVLSFLNHLETGGSCCTRTRNHRLSVLHAFFRYLQIERPTGWQTITSCNGINEQDGAFVPVDLDSSLTAGSGPYVGDAGDEIHLRSPRMRHRPIPL